MAGSDSSVFKVDDKAGRSGSPLVDFLYPRPAGRTIGGIFGWWEKRRLAYNAIIAAGGAVSLSGLWLLALLHGESISPLSAVGPIAVVLLAANVCYTLGPIAESLVHKLWGREVLPLGPLLFRAGLTFSVGLTLVLPMILLVFQLVIWVLRAMI